MPGKPEPLPELRRMITQDNGRSKRDNDQTRLLSAVCRYWDNQAATFDNEPDRGLRDPEVREA